MHPCRFGSCTCYTFCKALFESTKWRALWVKPEFRCTPHDHQTSKFIMIFTVFFCFFFISLVSLSLSLPPLKCFFSASFFLNIHSSPSLRFSFSIPFPCHQSRPWYSCFSSSVILFSSFLTDPAALLLLSTSPKPEIYRLVFSSRTEKERCAYKNLHQLIILLLYLKLLLFFFTDS